MACTKGMMLVAVFIGCFCTACSSKIESGKSEFGTLTVTPSSGTGADQLFDITLSRTAGAPLPALIGLLVNDRMDGGNACYVLQYVSANTTSLVADSGSGATPLGKAGSVGNQQCELLEGQTKSSTPSKVEVEFHLRFRANFHGSKQLYLLAEDAKGAGPGLKAAGEWTVP